MVPATPATAAPAVVSAVPDVSLTVGALTTNGRVNPLGIGGEDPAFGWVNQSDARGVEQRAYELKVGTSAGGSDIWSTGRRESSQQVDVTYDGPTLQSGTQYWWQVRTWDNLGTASDWSTAATFETGLIKPADWGNAAWVGRPAPSYDDWTDYTTTVQFDLNAVAFATFLRARDTNNAYMWQLNVGENSNDVPRLVPHVKSNGGFQSLTSVDLRPFGFTRAGLLDGQHTMAFRISGNEVQTTLDTKIIDTRTVSNYTFGRMGFRTFGSESVDIVSVKAVKPDGTVLAAPALTGANPFTGGTLNNDKVTISGNTDALVTSPQEAQPLLRTGFETLAGKTIRSARIYASARGIYELSLNGSKVGDQYLAPGYTEYDKRILSQTYDVTSMVRSGTNGFGAALGDGWWAGKVGLAGKGQYGTDLSLIARMRITYTDGSVQWVDTAPSWKWALGPVTTSDLQIGERYDARQEKPGFDSSSYDDSSWRPVVTREPVTDRLTPQPDEPVRQIDELTAKSVTNPSPGVYIYDLGQNMVGVPRIRLTGEAGEAVKLRHAEVLNRDGTMYVENLRAALATDYYTFKATGSAVYQPTFTQHGFRYIEITGVDQAPAIGDVQGVVLGSDLPNTGTLTTSDPMLNQLMSNVYWSARGNFLSIPTDTPARDERLGWTGDINVFGPTANYLFDTRAFLGKWMDDVRDEQHDDGRIPAVVPSTRGAFDGTGPGWGDAIVTVPHSIYRAYGDTQVLRKNWPNIVRFYDFAAGRIGDDNLGAYDATFFTNDDWLSLEPTSGIANEVKTTAIWADTVRMMAEMAEALGDSRAGVYAERYAQIKRDFVRAYVSADGSVAGNTQTGFAMTLGMNLIEDPALKQKVGEKYIAKLAQADYHLRTGFIGTPWLLPALTNIGRDDLAYTMLLQKDYPSWGYPISKGATTIWERWNSIQPDGSFGPVDMNSFNHYAYGAVASWMTGNISGISLDEPGYKSSIIAPSPGGGLTEAEGTIETVYGDLASAWRTTAEGLVMEVTVPAGTTSEVRIPGAANRVTEGGKPLSEVEGVISTSIDSEDDRTVVKVGSGTYEFASVQTVIMENATVAYASEGAEAAKPGDRVLVSVDVRNNSDAVLTDRLVVTPPQAWGTAVTSAPVTIAPGATRKLYAPLAVPVETAPGGFPVSLKIGGATVATTVRVAVISVPPTEATTDHVDFGESVSETAHNVVGSPTSGTNSEAGFTRRYANNSTPGSFYSTDLSVETGEPYVLRMRETWNSAGTKDYDILVDDVLVKKVRLERTQSGQGVTNHQVLISDPTALDADGNGKVKVTFRYPTSNGARQYYDPSIADLWAITYVQEGPTAPQDPDVTPPTVVASTNPATPQGDDGWWTSEVTVTLTATDDRDAAPSLQQRTSADGQWIDYTGVTTFRDGKSDLQFRAVDQAGNTSTVGTLTLKVDTVTPVATANVSEARVLTLGQSDANPGLLEYRLGPNSEWVRYSRPVHLTRTAQTVFFRASDAAGNTSGVQTLPVRAAAPAQSSVAAKVLQRTQTGGRGPRARVRFTVKSTESVADGTLIVRDNGRIVRRVTLPATGRVTYALPRSAARGGHRVVATYRGNGLVASSRSTTVVLRVKR